MKLLFFIESSSEMENSEHDSVSQQKQRLDKSILQSDSLRSALEEDLVYDEENMPPPTMVIQATFEGGQHHSAIGHIAQSVPLSVQNHSDINGGSDAQYQSGENENSFTEKDTVVLTDDECCETFSKKTSQWWRIRNLNQAVGITEASRGLTTLVMAPLYGLVLNATGPSFPFFVWGILLLLVAVPICFFGWDDNHEGEIADTAITLPDHVQITLPKNNLGKESTPGLELVSSRASEGEPPSIVESYATAGTVLSEGTDSTITQMCSMIKDVGIMSYLVARLVMGINHGLLLNCKCCSMLV
eukprot:g3039.t1